MPDVQRVVARLFAAALWTGVGLVTAAGAVNLAGLDRLARGLALLGVGIVVGAPFVVLVGVVAVARQTSSARWAFASLAIALLGYLLAR